MRNKAACQVKYQVKISFIPADGDPAVDSCASRVDRMRKQAPVHCERRSIVLYLFVKLHIVRSVCLKPYL